MSIPEIGKPPTTPLAEMPRGQDCDFFCYVVACEALLTRAGKRYLRITIRDQSRAITFPVWREAPWWEACEEQLKPGAICKIRAAYHESAHGPQLEIRKIRPATKQDAGEGFEPDRLLPPPRGDSLALFNAVRILADTEIASFQLRQTTCHLLDSHREGWLSQAGGRWHHAERGGLIEHTYFTLRSAISQWETYSHAYEEIASVTSRDLVIAGAILHDVGRIEELRIEPQATVTTTLGDLIGHPVLGRDKVRSAAQQFGVDAETLLRLEHILLSHHSRADYGSPMPPMTMEALIVHLADDADARLIAAMETMLAEPNAEWTTKRNPTGQKWYKGGGASSE